jgi:hypothetical protein
MVLLVLQLMERVMWRLEATVLLLILNTYVGSLVNGVYSIYEYNPSADIWLPKSSPNFIGTINAHVFVLNGNAYINGGFAPGISGGAPQYDGISLKTNWKYDPIADVWTRQNNMPESTGRHLGTALSLLDRGYLTGGLVNNGAIPPNSTIYNKYSDPGVLKYNPVTDSWSPISTSTPLGQVAMAASAISSCEYGYIATGTKLIGNNLETYNLATYRYEGVLDNNYITGGDVVCSTFDAPFQLLLTASGYVTWSTSANIYVVSGQGTKNVNVRSSSTGTGWIQASINLGCRVVTFPQKTVWAGPPPANSSHLIWSTIRGENPITVGTGSFISYQVDNVPYTDSYTWTLPRGFRAYGSSTTTASPYISITSATQTGTFTLYCRANNACNSNYTNSLTINVTNDGGGGYNCVLLFLTQPTKPLL